MSYIGKNIKKIRTVKNLSQAAFAQLFNLARPSVGAYEEGRSEPKIETLVQIAKYFGVSVDALLTKELTINELYKFDIFKQNYKTGDVLIKVAGSSSAPPVQTAEIALVKAKDAAIYAKKYNQQDYQAKLPGWNCCSPVPAPSKLPEPIWLLPWHQLVLSLPLPWIIPNWRCCSRGGCMCS